jgi:Raf kinase inhibitor-like YbhB/YbcL family protein
MMGRVISAALALAAATCNTSCATGEPKMSITVTSPAFADNQPIPRKYTGDGQDISPPMAWSGVPTQTRELALVCDDPDAPTAQPWVHWVLYKIPPDATGLDENIAPKPRAEAPAGALQGRNSWTSGRTIGYRGPAPPPGKTHRYRFHVYALDAPLDVKPQLDKPALLRAIERHVLAEGVLTGTYRRD